jgi:hypothetical protein
MVGPSRQAPIHRARGACRGTRSSRTDSQHRHARLVCSRNRPRCRVVGPGSCRRPSAPQRTSGKGLLTSLSTSRPSHPSVNAAQVQDRITSGSGTGAKTRKAPTPQLSNVSTCAAAASALPSTLYPPSRRDTSLPPVKSSARSIAVRVMRLKTSSVRSKHPSKSS